MFKTYFFYLHVSRFGYLVCNCYFSYCVVLYNLRCNLLSLVDAAGALVASTEHDARRK